MIGGGTGIRSTSVAIVIAAISLLLSSGLGNRRALAAESDTSRTPLADHFIEESRERPPLYQSAPVTHFVPAFNTVTYALDARVLDTTVVPEGVNQNDESLTLTGYSVAPYVALSLKRVGIGFNVEGGHKSIAYESHSSWGQTQESRLDYRGLGVYGFFKIYDSKILTPTIILGGKSLNAEHEVGGFDQTSDSYGGRSITQNYTLTGYNAGFNLGIHLVKSFTIIPWVDYAKVDDGNARSLADKLENNLSSTMNEDLDVFWQSEPALNYGLDFAVRINRFEIRLGGLLGMVVSSGSQSAQITDKGYSVSFSWDHKG